MLQRYKAAPESIFYIIHMIPQSQFLVLVVLVSPPLFLPTQHSPYAQKPQARKQYKGKAQSRLFRANTAGNPAAACVHASREAVLHIYFLSSITSFLKSSPLSERPALTAWQLRAALGCRAPSTVPKTPPHTVGGVTFFAAPEHAPLVTPQVLPVSTT